MNRTYVFDQSDITNWYHLIGFAYEADGAHVDAPELEPGIGPPGSESTCAETNACPAPMYFKNGIYQGEYSNLPDLVPSNGTSDNFGLDEVEPLFFHPIADWKSYGVFETYWKFDVLDYTSGDLFYFCHVHSGMSARIKLLDEEGNLVNPDSNTPEIPYDYATISEYDESCGTFNLTDWQLPNDQCVPRFVCGDDEASVFKNCVDSMNCRMMASMTSMAGESIVGTFCRQMIPHHENAINMAKSLLKTGNLVCDDIGGEEEPSLACEVVPMLMDIINGQNAQILDMQGVLEQLEEPLFAACDASSMGELDVGRRDKELMVIDLEGKYKHGIECQPCTDAADEELCEIKMKVDFFTSELGTCTIGQASSPYRCSFPISQRAR